MSGGSYETWLCANPAPDLQELVARHGSYEKIPPEKWAEFDRASQAPKSAEDCIDEIGKLAELAANIFADAHRLRDRVTELENDGMEIRAAVDAVDRLHATADAASRELAAVVKDFDDWMGWSWNP